MGKWQIREGDARTRLAEMDAESVQTCITSPPYWGLRDYGSDDQLGLEPTPEEYVENLVKVFREVKRVLRDDGTLWLNLGDSYCSTDKWGGGVGGNTGKHTTNGDEVPSWAVRERRQPIAGLKPKDLVGIPWRVAFALRADGWYLRSDIIWAKPNPMPESVTDRPTKAHEYLFLLSKQPRYFYDADAIREEHAPPTQNRTSFIRRTNAKNYGNNTTSHAGEDYTKHTAFDPTSPGRNRRSVWTVTTQPYSEAHFATFPPKLVEPCILAGSAESDTVLDPFVGSGTTGLVALRHNRSFIGIELNPTYCEMARNRIRDDAPLFNIDLEVAA